MYKKILSVRSSFLTPVDYSDNLSIPLYRQTPPLIVNELVLLALLAIFSHQLYPAMWYLPRFPSLSPAYTPPLSSSVSSFPMCPAALLRIQTWGVVLIPPTIIERSHRFSFPLAILSRCFLDRERRYRMLEKKASLLDYDCGRQRLSDVTVCQPTVSCLLRRLLWRSPVSQHTSLLVVSVKALLVIDEGVFGPFWIWFAHQEIVFLL